MDFFPDDPLLVPERRDNPYLLSWQSILQDMGIERVLFRYHTTTTWPAIDHVSELRLEGGCVGGGCW